MQAPFVCRLLPRAKVHQLAQLTTLLKEFPTVVQTLWDMPGSANVTRRMYQRCLFCTAGPALWPRSSWRRSSSESPALLQRKINFIPTVKPTAVSSTATAMFGNSVVCVAVSSIPRREHSSRTTARGGGRRSSGDGGATYSPDASKLRAAAAQCQCAPSARLAAAAASVRW